MFFDGSYCKSYDRLIIRYDNLQKGQVAVIRGRWTFIITYSRENMFLISRTDVIYSFCIPALKAKADTV